MPASRTLPLLTNFKDYDAEKYKKMQRPDKVIDHINRQNGTETVVLGAQQYKEKDAQGKALHFADAHAPWLKGGIENTNGLIRQYIPKGTDFKDVSQQKIKMIQRKINARPREKLNFLTPDEAVYKKTS
jgi:IS30 family transposase